MSTPAQITGQLLLLCLDPFFLSQGHSCYLSVPCLKILPSVCKHSLISSTLHRAKPLSPHAFSSGQSLSAPVADRFPFIRSWVQLYCLTSYSLASALLGMAPPLRENSFFHLCFSMHFSVLSSLSLSCWHHSVEHAFLPETVPAPDSHDTILFGSLTYTFFAGSSPSACPKLLGVP